MGMFGGGGEAPPLPDPGPMEPPKIDEIGIARQQEAIRKRRLGRDFFTVKPLQNTGLSLGSGAGKRQTFTASQGTGLSV